MRIVIIKILTVINTLMNSTMPTPNALRTLPLPVRPDAGQISLNSIEILRGQKAIEINHNGSTYKLQATRLGKLILTK